MKKVRDASCSPSLPPTSIPISRAFLARSIITHSRTDPGYRFMMKSKENTLSQFSNGQNVRLPVKQEPLDHRIPLLGPSIANNPSARPQSITRIKVEPSASAAFHSVSNAAVKQEDTKGIIKPREGVTNTTATKAPSTSERDVPINDTILVEAIYKDTSEIFYTPERSMQHGLQMLRNVKNYVNELDVGSSVRKNIWLRDISNLEKQGAPTTMIAVCGATGAGKSSIMNAILDDNIVPTSGMRACTAVVTEISYHDKHFIAADVSFLTEKEWRDELQLLLEDLIDDDGTLKRTTDLRSEAGVAWHKVHAVYPKVTQERLVTMTVDQLLGIDKDILSLLGSVKKIAAKDSREFAKRIAKYIDSKDQKRGKKDKADLKKKEKLDGPALWPLIRQVNVRCNSQALKTGAVLVDLPGVADANAARNGIAKDYMKKCNCIWILAPITRAVDDKTAKDLLGDAFKSQIMNGGFTDVESTITFIATKCDDISCNEVIQALQLEEDPILEEIESRLTQAHDELQTWRIVKQSAEKEAKSKDAELKGVRADIAEREAHIRAIEDGKTFNPVRTKPGSSRVASGSPNEKKRKKRHDGKTGTSKRRKSEELGDLDDFDMDLDEEDDDELTADSDDLSDEDSDSDVQGSRDESDSDSYSNSDSDEERSDPESDQDCDSDIQSGTEEEADEPITVESIKAAIKEDREKAKGIKEKLNDIRKRRKEAVDALANIKEQKQRAQQEKNAFCSLRRSEFSKDVLKEDFRSGLKELDDAAAEERDPNNFDPSIHLRDYANINLPVFTCSSRDYIRLTKQVKGDGDPTCFSNTKDTGIPDLQEWCHKLTTASRDRAARSFRTQLLAFVTTMQSYIDNVGNVSDEDRAALRAKWQTRQNPFGHSGLHSFDWDSDDGDYHEILIHNGTISHSVSRLSALGPSGSVTKETENKGFAKLLSNSFRQVVADSVKGMQTAFKNGLEEKCQRGAEKAISVAVETSDTFAASMHWGTYRATLRRNGSWRRDLNEELISPMTRNIASSWAAVFEADLFAPFEKAVTTAINKLLKEFEDSCVEILRDRARNQAEVCRQESIAALKKTLEVVRAELNTGQKDVSRSLVPHVQGSLLGGYELAMDERGIGSVARQKLVFHKFIKANRQDLFEGGTEVIFEKLDKVAESVGEALKVALEGMAEKIEVGLSVLWEGVKDDERQKLIRRKALEAIKIIRDQLKLWNDADNLRT